MIRRFASLAIIASAAADGHWRLRHGGWARGRHRGRDHDGVPNRYDRHPRDPYRR